MELLIIGPIGKLAKTIFVNTYLKLIFFRTSNKYTNELKSLFYLSKKIDEKVKMIYDLFFRKCNFIQ